ALLWGTLALTLEAQSVPMGPEFQAATGYNQQDPQIAQASDGRFVLVWPSNQDGSASSGVGRRYQKDGTPLGPEFQVNTYTTGSQDSPSVAMSPSGAFVV